MPQKSPPPHSSPVIAVATLTIVGVLEVVLGLCLLLPTLWVAGTTYSDKYITHTSHSGYFDFSDLVLTGALSIAGAQLAPILGGAAAVVTAALLRNPDHRRAQWIAAGACVALPAVVGIASLAIPVVWTLQTHATPDRTETATFFGSLGAAYSGQAFLIGVALAFLALWGQRRSSASLDAPLDD